MNIHQKTVIVLSFSFEEKQKAKDFGVKKVKDGFKIESCCLPSSKNDIEFTKGLLILEKKEYGVVY